MPTTHCSKERAEFLRAANVYSERLSDYTIAELNLEAALWESGAANIEDIKELTEVLHDAVEGHLPASWAIRAMGLMKSAASDKAAEARLKAANMAFDVAVKRLSDAHAAFAKAQAALDACLNKYKPHWSGRWSRNISAHTRGESHKGNEGVYGTYPSQFKSMVTYTLIGPKSSGDGSDTYTAHWNATADGKAGTWGKPYDPEHMVGTETLWTRRGRASGVADVVLSYDDHSGLNAAVTPLPIAEPDTLLITEQEIGAEASYTITKKRMLVGSGGIERAKGQKLKGNEITGTKTTKTDQPEFLPIAGFDGTYQVVDKWSLTVSGS